ncbi:MAG TPA: DUF2889 domain-containing protein, partial [Acidimicrobiales bacterium]
MFRDTYVEADGRESVIHEYQLTGSVDPASGVLRTIDARPAVVPAPECVQAQASVATLVGWRLADLRSRARQALTGPQGCTHLTDAVHALGAAAPLLDTMLDRRTDRSREPNR